MGGKGEKAVARLVCASGPMSYLHLSRALRELGWAEVKGRGSHKMWKKPGMRSLGFPVSNPGKEVRLVYLKQLRIRLGTGGGDHD